MSVWVFEKSTVIPIDFTGGKFGILNCVQEILVVNVSKFEQVKFNNTYLFSSINGADQSV